MEEALEMRKKMIDIEGELDNANKEVNTLMQKATINQVKLIMETNY